MHILIVLMQVVITVHRCPSMVQICVYCFCALKLGTNNTVVKLFPEMIIIINCGRLICISVAETRCFKGLMSNVRELCHLLSVNAYTFIHRFRPKAAIFLETYSFLQLFRV